MLWRMFQYVFFLRLEPSSPVFLSFYLPVNYRMKNFISVRLLFYYTRMMDLNKLNSNFYKKYWIKKKLFAEICKRQGLTHWFLHCPTDRPRLEWQIHQAHERAIRWNDNIFIDLGIRSPTFDYLVEIDRPFSVEFCGVLSMPTRFIRIVTSRPYANIYELYRYTSHRHLYDRKIRRNCSSKIEDIVLRRGREEKNIFEAGKNFSPKKKSRRSSLSTFYKKKSTKLTVAVNFRSKDFDRSSYFHNSFDTIFLFSNHNSPPYRNTLKY